MTRYSAKDLKAGSKVRFRTSDGWKETKVYKATDLFVWFSGMGVARMKRQTFDIYPDKYEIINL